MSETREFKNTHSDFDGIRPVFDAASQKLKKDIEGPLFANAERLLQKLERSLKTDVDWNDSSVYTGTSGIALLYMHLMDVKNLGEADDFLKKALSYIEPILSHLNKRRLSFLCGDPGPLAVGAVLYYRAGTMEKCKDITKKLESLQSEVVQLNNELPDELLYGRVGYLFSLLFVQKYVGKSAINEEIIKKVTAAILKSGQQLSKRLKHYSPLFYEWHEKPYLGAAHGLSGILYMLLQAKAYLTSEELQQLVKPSIDYVISLKFPSGNFPSSLGNHSDKLIHWCHGAPGVIHLLLLSYQVLGDKKYLEHAKQCSDVIWERGLLKKGYGICHGVSGNGYAHLRLFQVTKEEKYLYRAVIFGEWCYDYGKHGCRIPDRPLSLFEGLAGTVYYLSDLSDPLHSAFPAFQLV